MEGRDFLERMNDAFLQGELKLIAVIEGELKSQVPEIYGEFWGDPNTQRKSAGRLIFSWLEEFICQTVDSSIFWKKYSQTEALSGQCLEVIQEGKISYSCLECPSQKPTFICSECWRNSSHSNHKCKVQLNTYRICTCSELSTHSENKGCSKHNGYRLQSENVLPTFPAISLRRLEAIVYYFLTYAYSLLRAIQQPNLPDRLKITSPSKKKILVVYGGKWEYYSQVLGALEIGVRLLPNAAADLAAKAFGEGSSVLWQGTKEQCDVMRRNVLAQLAEYHSPGAIYLEVENPLVECHRRFSADVLAWLNSLISKSEDARKIFARILLKTPGPDEQQYQLFIQEQFHFPSLKNFSFLRHILLSDVQRPAVISVLSLELILKALYPHTESREKLIAEFYSIYPAMARRYLEQSCMDGVCLTALSAKMFSVPNAVNLMIECGVLPQIGRSLLTLTNWYLKGGNLTFSRGGYHQEYKDVLKTFFSHIELMLSGEPESITRNYNDVHRQHAFMGVSAIFDFFTLIQTMETRNCPIERRFLGEPPWKMAFTVQEQAQKCIGLLTKWCGSELNLLRTCIQHLAEIIKHDAKDMTQRRLTVMAGKKTHCILQNPIAAPVSAHQTIIRLFAGLCQKLGQHKVSLLFLWCGQPSPVDIVAFMDNSLQLLVAAAKVKPGMWIRNRDSVSQQILLQRSVKYRKEMFDKDIVVLQIAAALLPGDEFLINVMQKFDLTQWFMFRSLESCQFQAETLLDEFLNVLIAVVAERYNESIGEVSEMEIFTHEIVQTLAVEKRSLKWLKENLMDHVVPNQLFNDCLNRAATLEAEHPTSAVYKVKKERLGEFNPVFYHYSNEDQQKVNSLILESIEEGPGYTGEQTQNLSVYINSPPCFHENFAPITGLLHCDIMLHIMNTVLRYYTAPVGRISSETPCRKVLHLMTLALHEDKRRYEVNDLSFPFLSALCKDKNRGIEATMTSTDFYGNLTDPLTRRLSKWTLSYIEQMKMCQLNRIACPELTLLSEFNKPGFSADSAPQSIQMQYTQMLKGEKLQQLGSVLESRQATASDFVLMQTPAAKATYSKKQTEKNNTTVEPAAGDSTDDRLCAICRQHVDSGQNRRRHCYLVYAQRSSVLSQCRPPLLTSSVTKPWMTPAHLPIGVHVSTCGHQFHEECWERFSRGPNGGRINLCDLQEKIYRCPACTKSGNMIMPVLHSSWKQSASSYATAAKVNRDLKQWILLAQKMVHCKGNNGSFKLSAATFDDGEDVKESYNVFEINQLHQSLADTSVKLHPNDKETVKTFCKSLSEVVDEWKFDDSGLPLALWLSCAYTIQMLEQMYRCDHMSLCNGGDAVRDWKAQAALINCAVYSRKNMSPAIADEISSDILKMLVQPNAVGQTATTWPASKVTHTACQDKNVLSLDLWHLLVVAFFCLLAPEETHANDRQWKLDSKMYCAAGEQYLLRIVLMAHVVQVVTSDETLLQIIDDSGKKGKGKPAVSVDWALMDIIEQTLDFSCIQHNRMEKNCVTARALEKYLKGACVPLLRCAVLFFGMLTNVHPFKDFADYDFDSACTFLGLPCHISELFTTGENSLMQIVRSWCLPLASRSPSLLTSRWRSYPLTVKPLISLPPSYCELVERASLFTCQKDPYYNPMRSPLLCLLCGSIVCASSKCCSENMEELNNPKGGANLHAETCGMGTSFYLRILEVDVLLLSPRKGGQLREAPYVDEFGETHKLQTKWSGCALQLCKQKYQTLERLWAFHCAEEEILSHLGGHDSTTYTAF